MSKKLQILDKIFSRGGPIEQLCMDELNNAKTKILKQYDKTFIGEKKRAYRVQQYGPIGTLRSVLANADMSVQWESGDLIGRISIRNPPPYIRTQEFGFRAGQYKWQQRFLIVGYRPPDKPSKRGDFYILGNIRKNEPTPKNVEPYIMTITHHHGMTARLFLHAGRYYLRGPGYKRIIKRVVRMIRES